MLTESKEDTNKQRDILCSWIGKQYCYDDSASQRNTQIQGNLYKNPNGIFFAEMEKNHTKIHIKFQGTQNG